jgi:hypothetical protein
LELGPEYLWNFGALRIPTNIYESLERNWVWIEPTVVDEWVELMQGYESGHRGQEAYRDALKWRAGDKRDTQQVSNIVTRLLEQEADLSGVWTGEAMVDSDDIEIDHCIPYSLWGNNSLWNLLPSTKAANQKKRHRIPSRDLLSGSRERIESWWERAFVESPNCRRFSIEATASLPGVDVDADEPELDPIYDALVRQVDRMKRDQQVETWDGLSG